MKELIDDIKDEQFTKKDFVVYGFIVPCVFIAICILAESL